MNCFSTFRGQKRKKDSKQQQQTQQITGSSTGGMEMFTATAGNLMPRMSVPVLQGSGQPPQQISMNQAALMMQQQQQMQMHWQQQQRQVQSEQQILG